MIFLEENLNFFKIDKGGRNFLVESKNVTSLENVCPAYFESILAKMRKTLELENLGTLVKKQSILEKNTFFLLKGIIHNVGGRGKFQR